MVLSSLLAVGTNHAFFIFCLSFKRLSGRNVVQLSKDIHHRRFCISSQLLILLYFYIVACVEAGSNSQIT